MMSGGVMIPSVPFMLGAPAVAGIGAHPGAQPPKFSVPARGRFRPGTAPVGALSGHAAAATTQRTGPMAHRGGPKTTPCARARCRSGAEFARHW
jgi:hypothetical protein